MVFRCILSAGIKGVRRETGKKEKGTAGITILSITLNVNAPPFQKSIDHDVSRSKKLKRISTLTFAIVYIQRANQNFGEFLFALRINTGVNW